MLKLQKKDLSCNKLILNFGLFLSSLSLWISLLLGPSTTDEGCHLVYTQACLFSHTHIPPLGCPICVVRGVFVGPRCSVVCSVVSIETLGLFIALDSCRAVLFSCLPSRFAQENASVACHESARLPRPPLLLLAQETHTHQTRFHTYQMLFPSRTARFYIEGKLSFVLFFLRYQWWGED